MYINIYLPICSCNWTATSKKGMYPADADPKTQALKSDRSEPRQFVQIHPDQLLTQLSAGTLWCQRWREAIWKPWTIEKPVIFQHAIGFWRGKSSINGGFE